VAKTKRNASFRAAERDNIHFARGVAMRLPKPFYRKQIGSYYVELNRRWVNLGPDEKYASAKHHTIMANRQEPEPNIKVPVMLDQFLEWTQQDHVGNIRVSDVKPHHVTSWLSSRNEERL
jgi:hypothetical protein